MAAQKYPVGIQTFSNIIEEGYTYVDKTAFIPKLIDGRKYLFLSRPRRFGKSLLLSTLEAYFEGKRELFKGLEIYEMDVDWRPSPVFHFDFNAEDFAAENGLEMIIDGFLRDLEEIYGRRKEDVTLSQRFKYLIKAAYEKTGRGVVILVDKYDKPLLAVEGFEELYEKNQRIIKAFFGNLKTMDRYIRFALITGVARFSKVSIFSDLNNLDDISLSEEFADICGWTEEELLDVLHPGIVELAKKREETFEATLTALREYYDGYLFTWGGSRLYNPFSVLKALRNKQIAPYWFDTGTPTFLVNRIKARGTYPPSINGQHCTKNELMAVGIADRNPLPLMFQTGYLTIDSYNPDLEIYSLRFPNHEVEIGFFQALLPIYAPSTADPDSPFSFTKFKFDLYKGRPEDFMRRLQTLFKNLPMEDQSESVYRAVTFLLATLSASHTLAEHHCYKGSSDLEIIAGNCIYLFEFKYNKSVEEAMQQIYARDYAGRYALDSRSVYLIGVNYDNKKSNRQLSYSIERMK